MKVYNYTTIPLSSGGVDFVDREIYFIDENRSVQHASTTIDTSGDYDTLHIYPSSTGSIYNYNTRDIPNIWIISALFLSSFFFCFLIKITQKLKTRA